MLVGGAEHAARSRMLRSGVVTLPPRSNALSRPTRRVGRYVISSEIASGGMATVYFGRLIGEVGFSRSVAIKQLHPQYAKSPEFVAQFLDEARISARIRHPNVVAVLDVVTGDGELSVVMEYIEGEPLARLCRLAQDPVPPAVASAVLIHTLSGLHAAHEATSDQGEPLEVVHRDVSPQNILVGVDGTSHLLDFGVAKAASRLHTTENGQVKGKLAYMAPEQLQGAQVDRRTDVFAAGVVLWELLIGERLFARAEPGATIAAVLGAQVPSPAIHRPDLPPALIQVMLKALARDPSERFATAQDMALALESAVPPASALRVGAWVSSIARESIERRQQSLREAEEGSAPDALVDAEALQQRLSADTVRTDPNRNGEPTAIVFARPSTPALPLSRKSMALSGAALLALTGLFLAWPRGTPVAASAPAPMAQLAPTTVVVAAPVTPASPPTSADVISPESLPTAGTISSARAGADLISHPAPRKELRPKGPPVSCRPPYVLDAQGRKRFKPECF
jgi:eukaryotic-like serine/threonine-protein kinase